MICLRKQDGFSLIELIAVFSLMGILLLISWPAVKSWQKSASYKEIARNIALTLRDARARAVSSNLEHRVVFDVDGNQYQMDRGNLAYGSTAWPTSFSQTALPDFSSLKSGAGCNQDADVTLLFSPNGSCDSEPSICIMDSSGFRRYRVSIGSSVSARVVID